MGGGSAEARSGCGDEVANGRRGGKNQALGRTTRLLTGFYTVRATDAVEGALPHWTSAHLAPNLVGTRRVTPRGLPRVVGNQVSDAGLLALWGCPPPGSWLSATPYSVENQPKIGITERHGPCSAGRHGPAATNYSWCDLPGDASL